MAWARSSSVRASWPRQPGDVGPDPRADGRGRTAEPVLLGREHLDELAAAGEQRAERLGRGIREGSEGRPDDLGELGQDRRIEGVRLGQFPGRLGEVADLAGVDDHHGEPRGGQRAREGGFEPAGGLQDDQGGGQPAHPLHERGEAGLPIRDGPPVAARAQRDIEAVFGDINADEDWKGGHGVLLPLEPGLANAASDGPRNCSGSVRGWT
jgi:hypothetical protein